uniref:Uncharacterized protein n=1 Tax=Esox lucius TaxID=8010 RepID=A0AAY5K6Q1_ESOLU
SDSTLAKIFLVNQYQFCKTRGAGCSSKAAGGAGCSSLTAGGAGCNSKAAGGAGCNSKAAGGAGCNSKAARGTGCGSWAAGGRCQLQFWGEPQTRRWQFHRLSSSFIACWFRFWWIILSVRYVLQE